MFKWFGGPFTLDKLNNILSALIGGVIGIFIIQSLWTVIEYFINPQTNYLTSFPWYTSIIVYGISTLVVCILAALTKVVVKLLIRRKKKQQEILNCN